MSRTLWAALLALSLLAGCAPHAREPDQMDLVRVLGVDGSGPVQIMGVCGKTEEQEPVQGSASGDDFPQALACLPWVGQKELALTHLSHVIVGDGAALQDVLEVLAADRRLSVTAALWQGAEARTLLEDCEDPFQRLELLVQGGANPPTVAQVLADLVAGKPVELPRLVKEDGVLRMVGEALWCREEEEH